MKTLKKKDFHISALEEKEAIKIKAIVLAGGYGTRLHSLTENMPKPLLEVAGKPIIEHIINRLEELGIVDKIYIVTNDKFEQNFRQWIGNFNAKKPIELINDGTKSNEDRLGALGDIHYAVSLKKIEDGIIVVAGDNLFKFSLKEVVNISRKTDSNVIVLYDVKDIGLAKHYGVVEVENNIVINFKEKPATPKSTLISTGVYVFPAKTLPLIKKYIDQGNNPDKSGSFIEWLHKRNEVYAYVTDEIWYDIGSFEQLENANKYFKGK